MKLSRIFAGLMTGMVGVAALAPTPAQASLVGDEIFCSLSPRDSAGNNLYGDTIPPEFVSGHPSQPFPIVGDGIDCGFNSGQVLFESDFFEEEGMSFLQFDFGISVEAGSLAALAGDFLDLDWVDRPGEIVGFELLESTFPVAMNTSYTQDSVHFDFDGFPLGEPVAFTATFKIHTKHVPEPGLILGLSLLGGLGAVSKLKGDRTQK